jgi:DNA gyrase subunit B
VDSRGKKAKLSKRRWQQFTRQFKEYEGWSASLQAEYGHEAVDFLRESQLLDAGAATLSGARKLIEAKDPPEEPFETELVEASKQELSVKATHRKSGLARTHRLPAELFSSNDYRKLVEVHGNLLKQVGRPPFEVTLGERTQEAISFNDLRRAVLELARRGISLQRFKGLGEMNAEQLRETTMDPATRTLQQVTIEDATTAERVFSDLMGDKVEPRKLFIEKHARDVRFLDV